VGSITLFLLCGGWGPSSVEQAVRCAHQAAARDLLEALTQIPSIDLTVVATDDPSWVGTISDITVEIDIDPPGERFHFGRRLAALIERYKPERVLYTGGGSAPLLRHEQWAAVVNGLSQAERLVITNNLHSCDWAGIASAQDAAPLIEHASSDNAIAWVLAREASFPVETLPASAGTRFDIDTPTDLLIADRHPGIGRHLGRYLEELGWESKPLDGVLEEMAQEGGSLLVAGRVSSTAWQALEQTTRCWVRVFAEERGMRASGRQDRGEVQSLLADHLGLVGVERFFEELGRLANGVLLDNRVILAARQLWPSRVDRFNADLLRWREVADPFLRRLTRAAAEAPVPVVMGGHTVVGGGLMALTESLVSRGSGPD
jgi:2-phospho-L-lactate guanylyltransferase (CobY/MobA/RfbA family)